MHSAQMCASALLDLSQLATASAAFKTAAAVLQTIADESKQFEFHAIIPQMIQVRHDAPRLLSGCALALGVLFVAYIKSPLAITKTIEGSTSDRLVFWGSPLLYKFPS